MSDGVKMIFKTLIKVPCIILVYYIIFNIFSFSLTYFKLLGISNVIMQVAVENNYIPDNELETLNGYLDSITNTGVVSDASIIVSDNDKKQYGSPVTVGVSAHYKFILPLMPNQQLSDENGKFIGEGNGSFSGFADDSTLAARRSSTEANAGDNIVITYTVPGLQYYPDLG